MWSQPCAHVIFDTDPAPRGGHEPAKAEDMCQAMIRFVMASVKFKRVILFWWMYLCFSGMVDVQGDQFVAYFLPEKETLRKRKRDQDEEREYTEEDVLVSFSLFY